MHWLFWLLTWLPAGLLTELLVIGTFKAAYPFKHQWEQAVVERYEAKKQWATVALGYLAFIGFIVMVCVDKSWKDVRVAWPPGAAAWFGKSA